MAPLARRPCLSTENGCNWRTPYYEQITTIPEAEIYVRAHSIECIYNPVVVEETRNKREQEAADTARRWADEDEARARRWTAKDKAKAQR